MEESQEMGDLKYEILETLVQLPEDGKYHKELNLIQWGSNQPKYDLRGWNKDRSEMTKGVTLTKEELLKLKEGLGGVIL